jgi:Peptidogalycan biosysnthesis/recognition
LGPYDDILLSLDMLQQQSSISTRLLNSLEPPGLIQHFLHCPPEGFEIVVSAVGQPGFLVKFDLLTTMDAGALRFVNALPAAGLVRQMLTWRTLFWGTTVTEYLPVPSQIDGLASVESMLTTWRRSSRLCVLKDIPNQSPLLTEAERIAAAELIDVCKSRGFILIAGQALAYVPIDFENVEEYLSRLSSSRRKNIRRKMRARADIQIEMIDTGCERLNNAAFLNELYELYLNVYRQSDIHFDKLSAEFFSAVFKDPSLDGHLFLYYSAGQLIGFNLCFIHNSMLIDKYIGFRYPAAREHNLYFVSWMENLAFALSRKLRHYVAGWTDPEIKAYLGAKFTFTQHAVYVRNPVLRRILAKLSGHFEHDKAWFEEHPQ